MILDTCALIWLAEGGGPLSSKTLRAIAESPTVYISPISGFEIGWKHAKGGLDFDLPPEEWYALALKHHDLTEIAINGTIAIAASLLPQHHRDPADRIILATAITHDLKIVTHDRKFEDYGVTILK